MGTKHILGLDLGTNSIGWAVVDAEESEQGLIPRKIVKAGSRILPMDAAMLSAFETGKSLSPTSGRAQASSVRTPASARTQARSARRLIERRLLRRERLNRVLKILGYLPSHYFSQLNEYGQIEKGKEPKLAWREEDGKQTFVFRSAFEEMCEEFRAANPERLEKGKLIAYDWTVYYLRKKALTQAISGQELAWILHQFNQKRGYKQARGEETEENPTEKKECLTLEVTAVNDTGESGRGKTRYEVVLENGWVYHCNNRYSSDWIGKKKNFIATTKLNADGSEQTDKEGKVCRSLSIASEDDWTLLKLKTEQEISTSGKTIGEYIYDALLQNPDAKIIGQLVRVADRKLYRQEIEKILRTQMRFLPELQDKSLYQACAEALYPHNDAYRQNIIKRDFVYLITEDILLYQRPLKSKKSLINECAFEYHIVKDSKGEYKRKYLKCISKSHPLYEEFRVRQFVNNLAVYRADADGIGREDCTATYISDKEGLTAWLMEQKEIGEAALLKKLNQGKEPTNLSWNYIADKVYPMAPTCAMIRKAVCKNGGQISDDALCQIWHILYSVSDKTELEKALTRYATAHGLTEGFVTVLKKAKPFEHTYGSYSLKATEKLLQVMRSGAAWGEIAASTRARIEKIITGEYDASVSNRVREKCAHMEQLEDFQGLPLWLAEYVVYGEQKDCDKWSTPEDIDQYLQTFRLHSLNNPIVESVVTETLRVVRDIWREQGTIDEIHLEMGRELKSNADKRRSISAAQQKNEQANLRAKLLLQEFMNPDMGVDEVRGYSPSQLELFRIYEEGVLQSNPVPKDIQQTIDNLGKAQQPTAAEVKKYRLWLEQKYISPYTGQIIPLSKLFTPAYQIEHIIPQSRYFDDSLSNKVICEAEVNALKDRLLAHEFIVAHGGESVTLCGGRVVEVLRQEAYEQTVKQLFSNNKPKMEKLMLDDIPEKFIERQLNDSRYISVLVKGLLSNIVRAQHPETHAYESERTSKNLIVCTGRVTDILKKDWGLNEVWNRIVLPRFERLNTLQNTTVFTARSANGHTIPAMPVEVNPHFQKKRIDHRHHAMDAIVIACATRNHVNLISNETALERNRRIRYDLSYLLRGHTEFHTNGQKHIVFTEFLKPWESFTQDAEDALRNILVSFKQNLRVINKTSNYIQHIGENGKKTTIKQQKGDNWAIRKSLHKDTVYGLVNLQQKKTVKLVYALTHLNDIADKDLRTKLKELVAEGKTEKEIRKYFTTAKEIWQDINLNRIEVYCHTNDTADRYYAVRTKIDGSFDAKTIESITDKGIQQILLRHLANCGNDPKAAFSPDGIEHMNRNIVVLNNGVMHKPILSVRKFEKAEKFAVGQLGAKSKKFVEADKGTNLYFAIYTTINDEGEEVRSFVSVPLRAVIQSQKEGKRAWKPALDKWIKSEVRIGCIGTYQYQNLKDKCLFCQ